MKKLIHCLIAFFLTTFSFAQNADSLRMTMLGGKLQEYYKAIERESLQVQAGECDFLIESTTDSLLRQFVALDAYGHYYNSPLMGSENVAIHIFDKWIDSGKVKMKSQEDLMVAKIYAEFNRLSLIGKQAPELQGLAGQNGKYRVLYFYDTDCAKCKFESILLRNLLDAKSYPVQFVAFYVGDDRQAWEDYIIKSLNVRSETVETIHSWDPAVESDYQRKYGVIQTPRLFLIAPDGTILGRGLDSKALEILLDDTFQEKTLAYGTHESELLYDGIFAMSAGNPTENEVKGISDYIHDKTLARGDTLMFRQMAGDYLYYLASHSGEGFKEGMRYHINKNILVNNGVWKSSDDSLKVIGLARIMDDLLSKAAPGTKVPAIKVPGLLYSGKKVRNVKVRLDRLRKDRNYIMFLTEGCEVCAAQKEAAAEILKKEKVNVLMVNMDDIMESSPSLASKLMDAFDLSSFPYILITDSRGDILRRYFLWHTL